MKGPSISEQFDEHLENKERHAFAKQVDQEARDDTRQTINHLEAERDALRFIAFKTLKAIERRDAVSLGSHIADELRAVLHLGSDQPPEKPTPTSEVGL